MIVIRDPIVNDFVLEWPLNISLPEAIARSVEKFSKLLLNTTLPKSEDGRTPCYFTMLLQMKPVSLDFNERYSCTCDTITTHLYIAFYADRRYRSQVDKDGSKPQLEMKGLVVGPTCSISMEFEAATLAFDTYPTLTFEWLPSIRYYSKALHYVVMVSIVRYFSNT